MVLEERHGQRDQVIEIDRLVRLQGGRIAAKAFAARDFALVPGILARLVGETRALFQFEISDCSLRMVALSTLPASSETIPKQSVESRIEKLGL
jgi:hypothetical protein